MDDVASRNTYGVARGSTGNNTGDGTALSVTLGHRPKQVTIWNLTDATMWQKIDGMPANASIKTVTAGTLTADTTTAIAINDTGFTCSAALNANAKAIYWVAD